MRSKALPTRETKVIDIKKFFGEHSGRLCDGQIVDSNNVRVLSGGALTATLASRGISVGESLNIEGVYTYSKEYDAEYETFVTPDWVYANICTEETLGYAPAYLATSRVLIKDIGCAPKDKNGYKNLLGAFEDGGKIYVFYEASYHMIDERRFGTFSKIGTAYVWQFNTSANNGGSVCIYSLSQVFMDVIDAFGNISTTFVDSDRILLKDMTKYPYLNSTLMSIDGAKTYKYLTVDYTPSIGASYSIYFDNVYAQLYPTLSDYTKTIHYHPSPKRMVRYSNRESGAAPFGSWGEKLLVLPDMRLLEYSGGKWKLSKEKSNSMPTFYSAVQYFDRLFGICGDTVYASCRSNCSDFTEAIDNLPAAGGWKMITEDKGGFTAIAAFGGRVVAFTEHSMMTVRGSDLPFTLSYVGDYGCVSQNALAALNGELYFVSREGVMCYNGSSVKNIGETLPRGANYSLAALTATSSMIVLYNGDGNLWLYEPSSGEWSRGTFEAGEVIFTGENMIARVNGTVLPYALFRDSADFSFGVALSNGGRRRIKSISVTASVGFNSKLSLSDGKGKELMYISETEGKTVTRTFMPRNFYIDNGAVFFEGHGDFVLYGLRIEYSPLSNSARRRE